MRSTSTGSCEYLPHRYPFLLVDRVLACEPGKSMRALKNVTINEPFFQGHFPGSSGDARACWSSRRSRRRRRSSPTARSGTRGSEGALFFFAGIDNARFRRQVVPGDQLRLEVDVMRIVRGVGKFAAARDWSTASSRPRPS